MYHGPGAVEKFIIVNVGCMLIAHIYKGLYLCAFCLRVLVKLTVLSFNAKISVVK